MIMRRIGATTPMRAMGWRLPSSHTASAIGRRPRIRRPNASQCERTGMPRPAPRRSVAAKFYAPHTIAADAGRCHFSPLRRARCRRHHIALMMLFLDGEAASAAAFHILLYFLPLLRAPPFPAGLVARWHRSAAPSPAPFYRRR